MSDMSQLSDEELMKKYQNGNEMAFMILYKRHSAKVYGFLLSKLRDRGFTDDVFQATFLKLHQTRGKYDATLPFMPWLFAVCRSCMIDSLRKKARILEESDSEKIQFAPAHQAPKSEDQPLLPSFERLSSRQRQVLELHYWNDLSFEEMAEKLETTSMNVRQMTSRAIRKLRALAGKEKNG